MTASAAISTPAMPIQKAAQASLKPGSGRFSAVSATK